ncbi:MAG: hypothetical protein II627_02420 [Lachnospiraceae bacterium]|nr:hypothetical protein [Lachnospiraceae bacterium]
MTTGKENGAGGRFPPGRYWPYLLIILLAAAALIQTARSFVESSESIKLAEMETVEVPQELLSKSGQAKYPYIGMSESKINWTLCGFSDKTERLPLSEGGSSVHPAYRYSWYSKDKEEKLILQVVCRNKKVYSSERFFTDTYWYKDGSPDFTGVYTSDFDSYDQMKAYFEHRKGSGSGSGSSGGSSGSGSGNSGSGSGRSGGSSGSGSGKNSGSSSHASSGKKIWDPYGVEDYDDPEDFADDWAEEFGEGNYEEGYDDAVDYWEEEHGD